LGGLAPIEILRNWGRGMGISCVAWYLLRIVAARFESLLVLALRIAQISAELRPYFYSRVGGLTLGRREHQAVERNKETLELEL
jgi:hypothetical protein